MVLGSDIVQLLFQQTLGTHRVRPRKYLAAALETIVLAIIVTITLTRIWDPDQIWDHPAFITLGAFNFCFGWYAARLAPTGRSRSHRACAPLRDFAGGNYIGLSINSFIVYFLWRYTILVNMRLKLTPNPNRIDRGIALWNYAHAVSGTVFLLIFLVGPISKYDSPTLPPWGSPKLPSWGLHTVCFFVFVIASWGSFMATYFETKHGSMAMHGSIRTIKWYHSYYAIALSIANSFMIVVYVIQGFFFDHGGRLLVNGALPEVNIGGQLFYNTENCPPTHSLFSAGTEHCSYLSGWWVIVANWVWLITFVAAPWFIQDEPGMMESYRMIEDDEEPDAGIQMH